MLLGCARREIVLPEGFLPREGFTAQAHPLYARALLLGGEAPLLLVSLELTSLPDAVAARLQSAAARRAQISEKSVLIAATHTFSAPHIAPEEAGRPGALLRAVEDAALAAVGQALNDLREAELFMHIGESAVPANRDVELPDGWWVGCGSAGETDGTLTILRGETAGMTRLLLVHLNVQSSVLDQTGAADGKCVSGDLAGVACAALERRTPGATAIFLVGAAGDQAPAKKACGYAPDGKGGWKKIDLRKQGVALAEELGNRLADEAERAISGGGEPLAGGARIVSASVRLPLKRMPRSLQEMRPMRKCEWTPDGEGTQSVALLTLGELAVVCVRPELTCATGRAIQAASPFRYTLIATMVNGAAKYMPHRDAYAQCRYEAQNSPFMPDCAGALTDRVLAMLREARKGV